MQHLVDNPPQLDLLLRKAKSTLIALNIELHEEHVERSSPIALRPTSYAAANAALDGLPRASGE
ncbi:MAG: hypothetical protein WBE89_02275 [Methyloceanibacter sp.]